MWGHVWAAVCGVCLSCDIHCTCAESLAVEVLTRLCRECWMFVLLATLKMDENTHWKDYFYIRHWDFTVYRAAVKPCCPAHSTVNLHVLYLHLYCFEQIKKEGRKEGTNRRVRALLKLDAPLAIYVHYHAHLLNLALVDSVKVVPKPTEFFMLLEQLYVFVSGLSMPVGNLETGSLPQAPHAHSDDTDNSV